jgi:hypothetical protein
MLGESARGGERRWRGREEKWVNERGLIFHYSVSIGGDRCESPPSLFFFSSFYILFLFHLLSLQSVTPIIFLYPSYLLASLHSCAETCVRNGGPTGEIGFSEESEVMDFFFFVEQPQTPLEVLPFNENVKPMFKSIKTFFDKKFLRQKGPSPPAVTPRGPGPAPPGAPCTRASLRSKKGRATGRGTGGVAGGGTPGHSGPPE